MPGTVTVACKLPHGLHLHRERFEEVQEPVMGGGSRAVKRAVRVGRFTIAGTGRRVDDPRVIGGYALTPNVPADLWEAWHKANADSDVVQKGLIFAHEKPSEVEAEVRKNSDLRSGFEEVDPSNLPAEFRNIKTADKT